METDEEFLHDLAEDRAGNYLRFQNFVLDRYVRDLLKPPGDWCIVYTSNRDSDLLTESNERVLRNRLGENMGALEEGADVALAEHSCWAHGYRTGLYLRVFRDRKVTPSFRIYAQAIYELAQYPVLDENDHTERVSRQTSDNVAREVRLLASRHQTTKKYEEAGDQAAYMVEDWLEEYLPGELEDQDGYGGFPSTDAVHKAMVALGMVGATGLWPGR